VDEIIQDYRRVTVDTIAWTRGTSQYFVGDGEAVGVLWTTYGACVSSVVSVSTELLTGNGTF